MAVAVQQRAAVHCPQCPLYLCPPLEALEEGGPPLMLGLEGEHQRSNAALALQLANCWLQRQEHRGEWPLGVAGGLQAGSVWEACLGRALSTLCLAPHRPWGTEDIGAKYPLAAASGPRVPAHSSHAAW